MSRVDRMTKLTRLLVCIGAQKAGTSWLHAMLSRDARLAVCPFVKEVHYFDHLYNGAQHLVRWRGRHLNKALRGARADDDALTPVPELALRLDSSTRSQLLSDTVDDAWYEALLRPRAGELCSIDITPAYAGIGEAGFRHLAGVSENLYVLFILRNPVHRAWSGLLQGKRKLPGGIEGFIAERGNDLDFLFARCTERPDARVRNDYVATLDALYNAGLKECTLVRFYDDIAARPAELLDGLYTAIGVPPPSREVFGDALTRRVYETSPTALLHELEARL